MPTCYIPGCKSGYYLRNGYNHKDAPKRHFFRPPTNPEFFEKWSKAISRKDLKLSMKCAVCDLHFKDEFLIKTDTFIINGQTVELPRIQWKLQRDAVPDIFPSFPESQHTFRRSKRLLTTKLESEEWASAVENNVPTGGDNVHGDDVDQPISDKILPESQLSQQAENITPVGNESLNQIQMQSACVGENNVPACADREHKGVQILLESKLSQQAQSINSIDNENFNQIEVQRKLKAMNQRCHRLEIKNRKLEDRIKELTFMLKSRIDVKRLPHKFQTVVKVMMRKQKCKSAKGMRYDPAYILEAMLFFMKCPVGYKHCASHGLLPLPMPYSLQRLYRRQKFNCKVNETVIDNMKKMFKESPATNKSGILIFEEIKLRRNANINVHFDGCVDLGDLIKDASKMQLAKHALVFIFVPLLFDWVQPVTVYASCGATPGDVQAKILLLVLQQLESAGATIVGFTCDQSGESEKIWESLGISGTRKNLCNSIAHPFDGNRRLYAFSDPPQIIKCIRNNLQTRQKCQYKEKMVDYSYYSRLYTAEIAIGDGNRVVPKLTESHINPSNLQKKSVKRAANLFSKSVASGLNFYRTIGTEGFEGSEGTEIFTRDMRYLFDVTNSKLTAHGLRRNSEAHQFLQQMDKLLAGDSLDFPSRGNRESLRVTIRSILELAESLWGLGYEYLLTAKLNQDPVKVSIDMW